MPNEFGGRNKPSVGQSKSSVSSIGNKGLKSSGVKSSTKDEKKTYGKPNIIDGPFVAYYYWVSYSYETGDLKIPKIQRRQYVTNETISSIRHINFLRTRVREDEYKETGNPDALNSEVNSFSIMKQKTCLDKTESEREDFLDMYPLREVKV